MERKIIRLPLLRGMFFGLGMFTLEGRPVLEAPVLSPPGGKVEAPALLKVTHSNSTGTIFFTTDGTDPRDVGGGVGKSARIFPASLDPLSFGGPPSINRAMTVKARVKSGDQWSDLKDATYIVDQDFSNLLISEIMYHPTAVRGTARNEEFIEFKNLGEVPLDLSGMRLVDFSEGMEDLFVIFTVPDGVVAKPGGFVVFVANPASFESLYPGVPYDGILPPGPERESPLNNQIGRIALVGADGSVATQMRYQSHAPWPVIPDNHGYFRHFTSPVGFSLTRTNLDPKADPEHFSNWRASSARLGTPGADDPGREIPPLVINEILTRSTGEFLDSVEIYNPTPNDVPIGGWWLSDRRNAPYEYRFPPEMVVPANGYLVVDKADFEEAWSRLALSSVSERCYLFSGNSDGELTGYSHGFQFFGSDLDVTFGRVVTSDGYEYLLPEESPSLGAANSGPALPKIMITELMLNPGAGGFPYLELLNVSDETLSLWNPAEPGDTWSLSDFMEVGPHYRFPAGISVPPGGYLVCVPEESLPVEVPDHVQVIGIPEFLTSATRGEISLFRPSGRSGEKIRDVVVDRVRFQNVSPWDPGAAGGGQGLERICITPLGGDPASWCAGPVGGTFGKNWLEARQVPSEPKVLVSLNEGNLELRFHSEPGCRYALERSTDLETWVPSLIAPITGNGKECGFVVDLNLIPIASYLRVEVSVDSSPE